MFPAYQALLLKPVKIFPYRYLRNIEHFRQDGYLYTPASGQSFKNSGMPVRHYFSL
jgi:hypothetical protein